MREREDLDNEPAKWSLKQVVSDLPTRLMKLVWKLISWKGVMLAATLATFVLGLIPEASRGYVFVLVMFALVFDKKILDVVSGFKK